MRISANGPHPRARRRAALTVRALTATAAMVAWKVTMVANQITTTVTTVKTVDVGSPFPVDETLRDLRFTAKGEL